MVLDNTKNIGYILYGLNSKVNNYNKKLSAIHGKETIYIDSHVTNLYVYRALCINGQTLL
jgi:hypothetical protein